MTALIVFKAITDCVNALHTVFGKHQKPLRLYHALLEKTTVSHTTVIEKHNNAFRKFCLDNKDAILTKSYEAFVTNTITYSERVYIDMKALFNLSDATSRESHPSVWQHLLCLLALFDPASGAKAILEKELAEMENTIDDEKRPAGGNEMNFLNSLMAQGGNSNASNPTEAIGSIMSSGLLTDLLSGLQTGDLNPNKLFGGIKTMMSQMESSLGDDEGAKEMMSMVSVMMSKMEKRMNDEQNPSSITQSVPPSDKK